MQMGGVTARALARVLHGVSSPAFPADQWVKCGVWGRYGAVDFAAVVASCQQEMDAALATQRRNLQRAAAESAAQVKRRQQAADKNQAAK